MCAEIVDRTARPGRREEVGEARPREAAGVRFDLIELLFFAYRDFVGQPDEILAGLGFGRAHHRVLHFVTRSPGMTVADLLRILRITKQSLGRVLKELIDTGYIEQKEGPRDRRQRLLYPTAQGRSLSERLARIQSERIRHALAEAGPEADAVVRRFLFAMISAEDRCEVAERVGFDLRGK